MTGIRTSSKPIPSRSSLKPHRTIKSHPTIGTTTHPRSIKSHPAIGTTTHPRSTYTYKIRLSGKPHHRIRSLSSVLKGRRRAY